MATRDQLVCCLEQLLGSAPVFTTSEWQMIARFAEVFAIAKDNKPSKLQLAELNALITKLSGHSVPSETPKTSFKSSQFSSAKHGAEPSPKALKRAAKLQLIEQLREQMKPADGFDKETNNAAEGSLAWAFGILKSKENVGPLALRKQFLKRVKECHPDVTGSHQAMTELNEAWAIIRASNRS
jgi:hypothetical protein